jgi:hypothetical protein
MRRLAEGTLRVAALLLFTGSLLLNGLPGLWRSVQWIGLAVASWPEDAVAARARVFGEDWVRAIDGIRRAVPEDASYSLVSAGREWEGEAFFVRFELAPRRARALGSLADLRAGNQLPDPWVVVAFYPGRPPVLLSRQVFADLVERSHGQR